MSKTPNELAYAGFNGAQSIQMMKSFAPKPDIAKIGIPDAETNAEAIKLANACKARLNELIEALKA